MPRTAPSHRSLSALGTSLRLAATALLALAVTACGSAVLEFGEGDRVDTTTRVLDHVVRVDSASTNGEAADAANAIVRLIHVAGSVTIHGGATDNAVRVSATVHANAGSETATADLLDSVEWTEMRDDKGRGAWGLLYPVKDHRRYHYNPQGNGYGNIRTSLRYLGREIVVSTRKKDSAPTLYADLEITVPQNVRLHLENHLGSLDARNIDGELDLSTGSGEVTLEQLDGRLTVNTGSGDVTGQALRGEISVDTGSGDVDIEQLVGNGTIDTGSGDIRLTEIAIGRLVLDTGSGDVRVTGGNAGRLEVDTGSGDVRLRDVNMQELDADTGSGDVTVTTRLAGTRRMVIDTGSGDAEVYGEADAPFRARCDDLDLGYRDSKTVVRGGDLVEANQGEGGPEILFSTGSGRCRLAPA